MATSRGSSVKNTETSGGTRFNDGKPGMWWALPMYGLRAVAKVTMLGSKKYAPLDWACGQSYSTLIDSASRHWVEVLTHGPLAKDKETGLLHLAHMAWNVLCLLHFIEQGREDLDDVTKWQGVTTAMKQEAEARDDAMASVSPTRPSATAAEKAVHSYDPIRGECASPGCNLCGPTASEASPTRSIMSRHRSEAMSSGGEKGYSFDPLKGKSWGICGSPGCNLCSPK